MSKQKTWLTAVSQASVEFKGLDEACLAKVEGAVKEIMALKSEITSIFDRANGGEVCRLCCGECCRTGCYHFTAVDLLAYFTTSRQLFTPRFDNGVCPFLGDNGCMMDPCYRPYNCVTFVCEKFDVLIGPVERKRFAELSSKLIDLYRGLEQLFANRFVYGILNNGDRFVEGRSKGILWSGNGNNK